MMKRTTILCAALALCTAVASAQIATTSAKSYAHPTHRSKRYVITDFGAVGDGKTVNTKAIQAAIDKCASTKKGGVLVVPKGTFLSGAIFLKQGVNLLLEKDGVLKGTTNPDDYPQVQTRWEGTEEMWTSAFVNAFNVTGLIISGEGAIDGSGENWGQNRPPTPRCRRCSRCGTRSGGTSRLRPPLRRQPPHASTAAVPAWSPSRTPRTCSSPVSPWSTRRCGASSSSTARMLRSKASPSAAITPPPAPTAWTSTPPAMCMSIASTSTPTTIASPSSPARTPTACASTVPPKTSSSRTPTSAHGGSGVDMGSETSGGIRNVVIQNCVMDSNNSAPIRFKSAPSRGGLVENITYRNLVLHQTRQLIEMNLNWSNRAMARQAPPPPANPLPSFRNVKIINVSGDAQTAGTINGLPDSPIQGVTFQNCQITANTGLHISHARDIDLDRPDARREGRPAHHQDRRAIGALRGAPFIALLSHAMGGAGPIRLVRSGSCLWTDADRHRCAYRQHAIVHRELHAMAACLRFGWRPAKCLRSGVKACVIRQIRRRVSKLRVCVGASRHNGEL